MIGQRVPKFSFIYRSAKVTSSAAGPTILVPTAGPPVTAIDFNNSYRTLIKATRPSYKVLRLLHQQSMLHVCCFHVSGSIKGAEASDNRKKIYV